MSDKTLAVETKHHSQLGAFFNRLIREKPLGIFGAIVVLILLLSGIFADLLAPYGMNETHLADSLQPPSSQYFLGTDNLGRDILSRVIYGARTSVIIGLAATSVSIVISAIIGIVSGFFGGKIDMFIQRLVDGWMCFPSLIILIVLISIWGEGLWQVIAVLGLTYGISGSRIIRSVVIAVKANAYFEASRASGSSALGTIMRHILPNITPPIIVLFSTRVPATIMTEATLSFLGYGIPPPYPSWGSMLSGSARRFMFMAPYMALWPGLALALVVYGVNMFGDAVRDLFDPRLRGGIGRYGVTPKKAVRNHVKAKL